MAFKPEVDWSNKIVSSEIAWKIKKLNFKIPCLNSYNARHELKEESDGVFYYINEEFSPAAAPKYGILKWWLKEYFNLDISFLDKESEILSLLKTISPTQEYKELERKNEFFLVLLSCDFLGNFYFLKDLTDYSSFEPSVELEEIIPHLKLGNLNDLIYSDFSKIQEGDIFKCSLKLELQEDPGFSFFKKWDVINTNFNSAELLLRL